MKRESMMKVAWVLVYLGAAAAAYQLLRALSSQGYPETAARAGLACALAILPYVVARSTEKLTDKKPS